MFSRPMKPAPPLDGVGRSEYLVDPFSIHMGPGLFNFQEIRFNAGKMFQGFVDIGFQRFVITCAHGGYSTERGLGTDWHILYQRKTLTIIFIYFQE